MDIVLNKVRLGEMSKPTISSCRQSCRLSYVDTELTEWFLSEFTPLFFFQFEMWFSVTLNRYFEIRPSLTRTQFDLIIDDKHLLDLFQCFVVEKDCRFFLLQTNKQTSKQTNK